MAVWQILQASRSLRAKPAPSGLDSSSCSSPDVTVSERPGASADWTGERTLAGSGEARVEATPTWKGAVLLGRSTLAMSQLSEASWASHSR